MSMQSIIIFGRDDETTRIVYHALAEHFDVLAVVAEEKVSGMTVFRRRARRLGVIAAIGQALFVLLIMPVLKVLSSGRVREICDAYGLKTASIKNTRVVHVASINEKGVSDLVGREQPDAVIVNGTRLLSRVLLQNIAAPIINIHLGWNPRYRGGNGGYWALASGDREHCGVTVHLIDEGVDTGGVLARRKITPSYRDTFVSYPYLQLAEGLRALAEVLQSGDLKTIDTSGEPGALWHHPTIWGYIWNLLTKQVK